LVAKAIVRFLNRITRLRRPRCEPGQLLVLLPSCLQNSRCRQKVANDVAECRRCGRCRLKEVLELVDRYGCQCMVVTGGRLALQRARGREVAAIVAVACEKELQAGMLSAMPKPSLGIVNLRPHGPCKDTDVDVTEVERTIRWFLG